MRKKLRSAKMSLDDMASLHAEGKITDRQMWRAGGVCVDHINDPAYQRDAARATGLPGPRDHGPSDAGHIDAKANRRQFPKESAVRASTYKTDWFRNREARVQPSYDVYGPGKN